MSLSAGETRLASDNALINDRYRIERVLGRGGMGEVLAVVEPQTGRRFALKRLLSQPKPRHLMLLSREFHTLASLKHPNIVQAFDYGMNDAIPYYTMELLSGSDVDALAPMPWTEVVPILRDVASALSVVHARHLVHRDVGARNVWRTRDGSVKLIDFGAMTSFGASSNLAGTPPYVAPEALRTHILDQRTDLYSLGALGYYLLTGRHGYAARSLSDLEEYWADGLVPPSAFVNTLDRPELPALPEALELLIEALMSPLPEGRPASAAEVLDRLHEVLPSEESINPQALDGILASKAFVGREPERERLKQLLSRAHDGVGASAALIGPQGIGRSRLLVELAMEARVSGASALLVSGDGQRGQLSSAARALLGLLEALPSVARAAAARHAGVLGHLSEEVRQALGVAPSALDHFPELHGEARVRMQAALRALWLEVTALKPVALLLDDVQAMDDASVALFTSLAGDAVERKLLVVGAVRSQNDGLVPALAQPFVRRAQALALTGLALGESQKMLRSIFGDVEHLGRTTAHLAQQAEGRPGRLMELCEYLVHSQKVRCVDGYWVLPHEVAALGLPGSVVQLDEARLARLNDGARKLANALCVLEGPISIELCSALSPLPLEQTFGALDALCAAGILLHVDQDYSFRSETLRAALMAAQPEEALSSTHLRTGEALLALDKPTVVRRLTAGVHLVRGGAKSRGAAVVHRAILDAVEQVPEDHLQIAHAIEQAYELLDDMPLSAHERLSFLSLLSWAGYFVDRRFGLRYGDEALACGEEVCGMRLARKLAPWLGRKLGLYVALFIAGVRIARLSKKSALVPDLKMSFQLLLAAAGTLAGMHTLLFARDKVLASARAIEPLTALGPDHVASIVHRFAVGCAEQVSTRLGSSRAYWEPLIARLEDPRPIEGMSEAVRLYYRAACLYTLGSSEFFRDRSRTLEIADRIEQQPIKIYQISADQLRAIYYAQHGNMREAARYRDRVETRALERGTTWQVEVWEPCSTVSVATRQRDAMALKRAAGQLQHLSTDTPSLRDYVDIARASYLSLRGRYLEAKELLERLARERATDLVGHCNLIAGLAQVYNALGRYADAERVASEAIALQTPEDLTVAGLTLRVQIELALARAGLGRVEEAAAALDALLKEHAPHEGPLTLGALHEARAQVALAAEDETSARAHFGEMERWYHATDCHGLIQYCGRLARRWERKREHGKDPFAPSTSMFATVSNQLPETLRQESPVGVIMQLVRATLANEGALYWMDPKAGRHYVQSRAEPLPQLVRSWVDERMNAPLSTETEDSDTAESEANLLVFGQDRWRVSLLVADLESTSEIVGAVVLCNPSRPLPLDVLRALAQHLQTDPARRSSLSAEWS